MILSHCVLKNLKRNRCTYGQFVGVLRRNGARIFLDSTNSWRFRRNRCVRFTGYTCVVSVKFNYIVYSTFSASTAARCLNSVWLCVQLRALGLRLTHASLPAVDSRNRAPAGVTRCV